MRMPVAKQSGISMLELLVAMSLSVVLLGGVATMFASSRSTYQSNDRLGRIEESGRYALDMIARDLRGAGYVGCNKRATVTNVLNGGGTPGGIWNFSESIRGHEGGSTGWSPSVTGFDNATQGSDILILRTPQPATQSLQLIDAMTDATSELSVTTLPEGQQGPFQNNQIVMISDCQHATIFEIIGYDPQSGVITHAQTEESGNSPGNADGSLGYVYGKTSSIVAIQTVAYFVGDSINGVALHRRIGTANAESIVDGVEMMQIRYGYDTDGDRIADTNVTGDAATSPDRIVSVTIALLVRSPEEYGEPISKTYRVLDTDVTVNDRYMRKVFTTTALVRNTAR